MGTPILQEIAEMQNLKRGEIEFETDMDHDKYEKLQNLEFLWNKETLGVRSQEYKKTDEIALEKFHDSVEWDKVAQRYVMGMPFNDRITRLKQNKELAYTRLYNLRKKFVLNPTYALKYATVIGEHINKFAEEVLEPDRNTEGPVCYLPHRGVMKEDSSTTKLRIVFDGSAKCGRDEVCLNDCLMQGPNLVQLIAACLIKSEHRDVLRFLFPENHLNPLSKILVYRFKVVIFGANCSPFHLAAVLVKHL